MKDTKDINDAVDFLYTHGRLYAEAKAHRVYLEEFRKSQKSMLMKQALVDEKTKTSAGAEMEAYADPTYIEILKGLSEAVEKEETLRWSLIAAQARIEVYRTQSANDRAVDKAVM